MGVKFAAELLVMGLRMTLHTRPDFIIVGVDITNAYCEVMRASVIERHMQHDKLCGLVPYWRAKLRPVAKMWAGNETMEYEEGLHQRSPTSSSGFPYTIHEKTKKANTRLVEHGRRCARFGMDDGYMMGPKEVIFQVLEEFADGIKEEHGCELNTRKCKMYIMEEDKCKEAKREGYIPDSLQHIEEGIFINEPGDALRGIMVFNVPVGDSKYVEAVLRQKARAVGQVTRQYVEDLEEKYPRELCMML
jgi:hypothetical protein